MKKQNRGRLLLTCTALWAVGGVLGMQPATHVWASYAGAAAQAVSSEKEKRLLLEQSINDMLAHSDFLDSGLKAYLVQH